MAFELAGRIPAMIALGDDAEKTFGLLLCTRDPDGRRNDSGQTLLQKIPPAELWNAPPDGTIIVNGHVVIHSDAAATAAATHSGTASGAEAPIRSYNLPYDLLISPDEAMTIIRGAAPGCLSSDVREAEAPAVCNAHITYPKTRGPEAAEWDKFWRDKVRGLAGQWARVIVEPQKYSFAARGSRGASIQRVGTRLVMKSIAAFGGAPHKQH